MTAEMSAICQRFFRMIRASFPRDRVGYLRGVARVSKCTKGVHPAPDAEDHLLEAGNEPIQFAASINQALNNAW